MKKRESNFELLRIICMLMIVMSHIIMFHPSTLESTSGINYYIGNIVKSFVVVAVNCFILISGYYGINFKLNKLLKLESQVWSWSVIIFLTCIIAGLQSFNLQQCVKIFFPVV